MRKMKLNIDQLAVVSFSIKEGTPEASGTVCGNAATRFCTIVMTGDTCDTCTFSCGWTCVGGTPGVC